MRSITFDRGLVYIFIKYTLCGKKGKSHANVENVLALALALILRYKYPKE